MGPSLTNIGHALDLTQKSIQMSGGHEYFIPAKLDKYPSSDSVVKADYVFPYICMH